MDVVEEAGGDVVLCDWRQTKQTRRRAWTGCGSGGVGTDRLTWRCWKEEDEHCFMAAHASIPFSSSARISVFLVSGTKIFNIILCPCILYCAFIFSGHGHPISCCATTHPAAAAAFYTDSA